MNADEDIAAIKKRIERKIFENSHALKEQFRNEMLELERRRFSDTQRLDLRLSSLEQLLWKERRIGSRQIFFFLGVVAGIIIAMAFVALLHFI